MPKMNVMDAVVRVMESEGVDVVFGVPGAVILPLYKALAPSSITHVSVRHEEGGTHAADGYARVTGKVGVNIGTSGPAGTNMITGLDTAMADSIPMICITGQAPTDVLHKEAFQAVDIVEIAKPVTKWAVQVKETAQLPWAFRQAFRIVREGRPGPVLIDLPLNVQKGPEVDWDPDWDRVGIDHVAVMEAMGAMGRRVTEPGDIADTLRWAVDASEEHRLPVLVEIMTERDTDAAMGVAIDAVNEYEPILDGTFERSGAVVGALPEGD